MKNYLEHEIKVKFIDGVLAKSQEWQWFIKCVEENYELDEIQNYFEFRSSISKWIDILNYLISIIKICNKEWKFNNQILHEVFLIAKFSIGAIDKEFCKVNILSNLGKLLLVATWLTKLENADNETEYIIDLRFYNLKNFFQSINMESFVGEEDEIIKYLDEMTVADFENNKACIIDNLKKIPYGVTEGFLEKYKDNFLTVNAFNFKVIQKDEYYTWQEEEILDMISISIDEHKIIPRFSSGDRVVPDYTIWTSNYLDEIKSFFNHSITTFIVESIDYINNGVKPSKEVIDLHIEMLQEIMEEFGVVAKVYNSSSYRIVSLLFKDKMLGEKENKECISKLMNKIHIIRSENFLLRLKEDGFPLSKQQKQQVHEYVAGQYKNISAILDINSLIKYFKKEEVAKYITQEYYNRIFPQLKNFMKESRQRAIPELFYQTMLFLINVKEKNRLVDKRIVESDMISLQEYWQNDIYKKQLDTLHEFKNDFTLSSKQVDDFSNIILKNPIAMAQYCMIVGVKDIVKNMELTSELVFDALVQKMIISPFYPYEGGRINFENHDVDCMLKKQVDQLRKKFAYKFLNVWETEHYVCSLHERYREYATLYIAIFKEEEKLYDIVEKLMNITFIPYCESIQLGHLTQLFPLLEIQIRKMGKILGIVPFKEKIKDFMKLKDPSSVLREILEKVFHELENFENVADLLFVYHFMYNDNSLNIRNECLHGRDYLEGSSLKFAFKVTLLSLYMILWRISIIEDNIRKG